MPGPLRPHRAGQARLPRGLPGQDHEDLALRLLLLLQAAGGLGEGPLPPTQAGGVCPPTPKLGMMGRGAVIAHPPDTQKRDVVAPWEAPWWWPLEGLWWPLEGPWWPPGRVSWRWPVEGLWWPLGALVAPWEGHSGPLKLQRCPGRAVVVPGRALVAPSSSGGLWEGSGGGPLEGPWWPLGALVAPAMSLYVELCLRRICPGFPVGHWDPSGALLGGGRVHAVGGGDKVEGRAIKRRWQRSGGTPRGDGVGDNLRGGDAVEGT